MPTFVALLRAVNVGGNNRISMPELRSVLESMGHSAVATYIQSGNVVFDSTERKSSALAPRGRYKPNLRSRIDVGSALPVIQAQCRRPIPQKSDSDAPAVRPTSP